MYIVNECDDFLILELGRINKEIDTAELTEREKEGFPWSGQKCDSVFQTRSRNGTYREWKHLEGRNMIYDELKLKGL